MNALHSLPASLPLGAMPRRRPGVVSRIDWDAIPEGEGRRLREFGLDEGVDIELLHGAALGGGPVACRIGRMMVTFRAHVARAILVQA